MDRHTMKNLYKSRNDPVRNIEKMRNDHNQKIKIQRQDRRTRLFNERRSMSDQDDIENKSENVSRIEKSSPKSAKVLERKLALQKYKMEKEAIKQALNVKKKPPFIVGIPHHGNSPILKTLAAQKKKNGVKPLEDIKNKRVTRANSKFEQGIVKQENGFVFKSPVKMFPFNERKSMFMFQHSKASAMKKLTSPHTPTVLKRSAQKIGLSKIQNINNDIKNEVKNAKIKVQGKLLKKVLEPKKKKSSTSSTDSGKTLAAPLSDDKRKQQVKSTVPNCENKNSPKEQIPVKLDSPEKSEESSLNPETALQREQVDTESERLLSLAEEWESIALKNIIPRDTVDEIDSLVGQTRLLTRDKFNQFRRLIDQYECQQGSHKITIEDLNGFWDMMYLQVEPLVKRYDKLVILKNNNWVEPKPATPAKKKKRGPIKRKVIKVEISAAKQHTPQLTVKEDVVTMRTPTEENKPLQVLNLSRTPRRYSPSPYIAMRLSGVGRSLRNFSPNQVEPLERTLTSRTLLKTGLRGGNTGKKNVVLDASPMEVEETIECTPRRSMRLVGRTPGSHVKLCPSCQSPDCSTPDCRGNIKNSVKRRSRRSQKIVSVRTEQESENMPTEPAHLTNIQQETVEEKLSKKFVLRPSKLVWSESSIKSPVPEKTRRTLNGGKEHISPIGEDVESSVMVRRSTRIASAKRVTFNSSAIERHNFKLPATPYGKKGCNEDSLSDSFSD